MKCKQHPGEQGVGVCASCLRERLLALIASQNEFAAGDQHHHHHQQHQHRRRIDPTPPPPLAFPRSVSPYVAPRRSDASIPHNRHHIHRFFSTPQVGPASDGGYLVAGGSRSRSGGRLSIFSALFSHNTRSGDAEPDRSRSWISSLIRGKGKKKLRLFSEDVDARASRDRGMSPARDDDSACSSGYMTESSPAGWRRTAPTPTRRAGTGRYGGVSGFAVCLSPLVRAGPGGGRRCGAPEAAVAGELRAVPSPLHRRHASAGVPALAPNRSRKLIDLGRFK